MKHQTGDIRIKLAETSDVKYIKDIAYGTWNNTYNAILSEEQIAYMLSEMFNEEVLTGLILSKSQMFLMLLQNSTPKAFAAYGYISADVAKLSKIYILPECQGLGFGKLLIQDIIKKAVDKDCSLVELNVNRSNKAVKFYEKLGFYISREVDIPFGRYWMNDYVMRLEIRKDKPAINR